MASQDDSSAVGALVGRLVAAGRLPAAVGGALLTLVAPPANEDLLGLYSAYRNNQVSAEDLLSGLSSLAATGRSFQRQPVTIDSVVERVVRENDLDADEQEALVDAITSRDPAVLEAISAFEELHGDGSDPSVTAAAMRGLVDSLYRVTRERVRRSQREAAAAAREDEVVAPFPVHQLIHLTDTLRNHGAITTDVALGILSATQARDERLAAAYASYALGDVPFRGLCAVAAALGSAYALAEAEAPPVQQRASAAAPAAAAAAAPPPPPGSRQASAAASSGALDPARPPSATTEAAADLDGIGDLHAELVSSLRQEGVITGDDATTLRHLFVAKDARLAAAYRAIRETGDIAPAAAAILDIVAAERAADAATPEFAVQAVGSLAARGFIADADAEVLIRACAPRTGNAHFRSEVTRAIAAFHENSQVDALVETLEDIAAEASAAPRPAPAASSTPGSAARAAVLASVARDQESAAAANTAPASQARAGGEDTDDDDDATAAVTAVSRARLASLHERRALLATLSHLLASGLVGPGVAAALTGLIHNEDPVVIAAWRLYAATEDVADFIDTLCRAGEAALERSRGDGGDGDGEGAEEGAADDGAAEADEAAAAEEAAAAGSASGPLSRSERDVLLRAAQILRDVNRRVTPAEAAALMRAVLAAQSGAFEHVDDEAAAPALLSIAQVFARNGDVAALLSSLAHVARVLAAA